MKYLRNVLVAIDQLGNAVCGGKPEVTISARTGYFANIADSKIKIWWKLMEAIINFAFEPVDGPNHCLDAYNASLHSKPVEGSDLARALLGFLIIFFCIFIAVITRVWVMIFPEEGYKAPEQIVNASKTENS